MLPRAGTLALAVSLAATGAGCRRSAEEPPAPASVDAGAPEVRTSSRKMGVEVPLPPGWQPEVGKDSAFLAGPAGRPVLRVDRQLGAADQYPDVEQLQARIRALEQFAVSFDQEEEKDGLTLLRVTLAPVLADGGIGQQAPAMFGAKRIGKDLFLCASLPGAEAEEVRLATEACRGLQVHRGGELP